MDKSNEVSCKIDDETKETKISTLNHYQSITKENDDKINKKLSEIYQTIGEIITIQRETKDQLAENNNKLKKILKK